VRGCPGKIVSAGDEARVFVEQFLNLFHVAAPGGVMNLAWEGTAAKGQHER
jgi:hypothetical protein